MTILTINANDEVFFEINYSDKIQVDDINDYLFIKDYTEMIYSDWGKYYNENKKSPEMLNIIKENLNKLELERLLITVKSFKNFGKYFDQNNEYSYDDLLNEIFVNKNLFLEFIKVNLSTKFCYYQRLYKIRN